MDKKKKDVKLLVVLFITTAVGLVNLIFNGNTPFIGAYLLCTLVGIFGVYFSYSLCKWRNQWGNFWQEKNPGKGEPSDLMLTMSKAWAWAFFIIGMIFALIPKL